MDPLGRSHIAETYFSAKTTEISLIKSRLLTGQTANHKVKHAHTRWAGPGEIHFFCASPIQKDKLLH